MLEIRPVEVVDARKIIALTTLAMADDAYNNAFIPRRADKTQPTEAIAWRISRLENLIRQSQLPNSRILPMKVVDVTEDRHETIVSYAMWTKPIFAAGEHGRNDEGSGLSSASVEMPTPLPRPAGFINSYLGDELYHKMKAAKLRVFGSQRYRAEDFYVLESLATLPSFGGRGAASMLVQWGLDKAEAEGAEDVYIESTPAALSLYKRLGAEQVNEFHMLDGSYKYTCLLWKRTV